MRASARPAHLTSCPSADRPFPPFARFRRRSTEKSPSETVGFFSQLSILVYIGLAIKRSLRDSLARVSCFEFVHVSRHSRLSILCLIRFVLDLLLFRVLFLSYPLPTTLQSSSLCLGVRYATSLARFFLPLLNFARLCFSFFLSVFLHRHISRVSNTFSVFFIRLFTVFTSLYS